MQPPLIIKKARKLQAFQNKMGTQLGFDYWNNTKAWITASIYQDWLQQWDHDLGARKCKIVLFVETSKSVFGVKVSKHAKECMRELCNKHFSWALGSTH